MFLEGCGLPEAWEGRQRFTVGELGFGTGLNIAALLELWGRTRPRGARLHVFSVEAHPVAREDAARALSNWPELSPVTSLLLARWPGQARGMHRVELPELDAILDVAVLDVALALRGWSGRADAWFLDGFSPALNPAMWTDEVLGLVAARSEPGARAATFTVAGAVRRGLAAAGFGVEKRPGFGRKRERLEARLPGAPQPGRAPATVAIVGAGVAGAAAARAVRALGGVARVFEAQGVGAGASGNPSALVTPRLDAGLAAPAQLFASAFARAVRLYSEVPGAIVARGALQLAQSPRDEDRFGRIVASDLFAPGTLTLLDPEAASQRLGERSSAALDIAMALTVEPASLLPLWVGGEVTTATVASVRRDAAGWVLLAEAGEEIARADAVVVAAGQASAELVSDLPLRPVRGQASWTRGEAPAAAAWGGYVLPTREGLLFGATHDRDDRELDVREGDHYRNLTALAAGRPVLAGQLQGAPLQGRARLRATTPDRLPIAGAVDDGLYVLTGFGSRGYALAPLLAEHLAALICGPPSPLPADLADLVAPDRFRRRAARRLRS